MADETRITVKVGVIIGLIVSIMSYVSFALLNHQGRITTLEVQYSHTQATLSRIEKTLDDIRSDQVRRFYKYEAGKDK